MERAPQKFEQFFVHREEDISATYVKGLLRPPESSEPAVCKAMQMLYAFIQNADQEELSTFLFFLTGSKSITGVFEPGCVTVSVENTQGIFASTCLLELHIPSGICSYVQFESSMRAVLQGTKFTTV